MKIGIVSDSLGNLDLLEMLDWCVAGGMESVELLAQVRR
jgi:sugar phosphate isomerase/epimerase